MDVERQVKELLEGGAGLNTGERDVLLLCVMNGYSYEDTAVALDIPIGTVRSRVNRAKKKLRTAAPHLLGRDNDSQTILESRLS